jgi:hypothetical protein
VFHRLLQPGPDLLDRPSGRRIAAIAGVAALALAAYGFTAGCWRSPWMGCYVAVKMPLLVAATLCCNGMLNGLLGLLLGGLGFRESLLALLSAFAVAALLLGSLAPVTLLLALDAPRPDSPDAVTAHAGYLVFHVLLIAVAGIAGTLSLHRILLRRCPSRGVAHATLLAWLAGNGLLGAQFSWILRPFFGSPGLAPAFLREDPLRGSFHEAFWHSLDHFTGGRALPVALAATAAALVLVPAVLRGRGPQPTPTPPSTIP